MDNLACTIIYIIRIARIFLLVGFFILSYSCKSKVENENSNEHTNKAWNDIDESIDRFEIKIEENHYNSKLHLQLARKYVNNFENENDRFNALGLAIGEYITALDLGEHKDVIKEFEDLYRKYQIIMGINDTDFHTFYSNIVEIYNVQKDFVKIVISVKKDFDAISRKKKNNSITEGTDLTYNAIRYNIHLMYRCATGREPLTDRETGNIVVYGRGFFKRWDTAIRSFGFRVELEGRGIMEIFQDKFPKSVLQMQTGHLKGHYRNADGDLIVPGLKYLTDESKK